MSKNPKIIASTIGAFILLVAEFSFSMYVLEEVTDNLRNPWCVAQLPNGDFLITEKPGKLLRVSVDGSTNIITGTPEPFFKMQGGFFDVLPHPDFEENQLIFLSYAEGNDEANRTAVISARLDNLALSNVKTVLRVHPDKDTPAHYGGRLLFMPDGTLLITTGDGFEYREASQNIKSELGKVLRIRIDGTIPPDNPFSAVESGKIWTYGHRNPQGLAMQKDEGLVFLHEHGPKGGDEINILRSGSNFGWPAITYGVNYSGAIISPYTDAPGMEQPVHYWVPSIAPSGMAFYNGERFPEWNGDLFVGALVDKEVRRLSIKDGEIQREESIFEEVGQRVRDVRVFQDGYIYLLTDSDNEGKLIRVKPK